MARFLSPIWHPTWQEGVDLDLTGIWTQVTHSWYEHMDRQSSISRWTKLIRFINKYKLRRNRYNYVTSCLSSMFKDKQLPVQFSMHAIFEVVHLFVKFTATPVKLVCFDDVSVTVLSIIHINAGHWGFGALVPLKQYTSPVTSKITQLKSSSTLYCETWITQTAGDHQTKFELWVMLSHCFSHVATVASQFRS